MIRSMLARYVLPIAGFLLMGLFSEALEAEIQVRPLAGMEGTLSATTSAVNAELGFPENFTPMFERDHGCGFSDISCNSSVSGLLATDDCFISNGTFADFWNFQGSNRQTVTINLSSADFDTRLFLLNDVPEVVAFDDDGGPGTNSRINFRLNSTGIWTIGVNNVRIGDMGNYGISLACSGGGGGSTRPSAPSNLVATAVASDVIEIRWRDNSNNESEFRVEARQNGSAFQDVGAVGVNTPGANITSLQPGTTYDFRVRARNGAGNSTYSNVASATTFGQGGGTGPCIPSATTLCLNGDRFKVETSWRQRRGGTGLGNGVELTDDTGYFWFFSETNVELVIKVLDACGLAANRYWVFAGGLTNVEVDITVTDTDTGAVRRYTNPINTPFQPLQDTQAFATCP